MPGHPNCVFCKIIVGAIPAHVIYRDDKSLAFLDIQPLAPGHVLLVPLEHFGDIRQLPAGLAGSLMSVIPRLAAAVCNSTGATGLNLLQNNGPVAGQVVPHVHFHLIPRSANDGLGFRWNPRSYQAGEAERVATALRAELDAR